MRQKSKARRLLILQAAKAAFEEPGYEQASMSDIAARGGGSKATLYNYFKSKDELFQALMAICNRVRAVLSVLHEKYYLRVFSAIPMEKFIGPVFLWSNFS